MQIKATSVTGCGLFVAICWHFHIETTFTNMNLLSPESTIKMPLIARFLECRLIE